MRFVSFLIEGEDLVLPLRINLRQKTEEPYTPRFAKRTYRKRAEEKPAYVAPTYIKYEMDITIPSYLLSFLTLYATSTPNAVFKENRVGAVSINRGLTTAATNLIRHLEVNRMDDVLKNQIEQHVIDNPIPPNEGFYHGGIESELLRVSMQDLIKEKEKEWKTLYKKASPSVKKHRRPNLIKVRSFMRNKGYTLSDSQLQQIHKIIFDK